MKMDLYQRTDIIVDGGQRENRLKFDSIICRDTKEMYKMSKCINIKELYMSCTLSSVVCRIT